MDDQDRHSYSTSEEQITRSATIVSVGNVLSRVMGLAREATIANIYGASGAVSAFKAASQVPLQLYELLIGGMVSSALVPTLSERAGRPQREQLWRLASLLFTLAALALGLITLLLEIAAPRLAAPFVGGPSRPQHSHQSHDSRQPPGHRQTNAQPVGQHGPSPPLPRDRLSGCIRRPHHYVPGS